MYQIFDRINHRAIVINDMVNNDIYVYFFVSLNQRTIDVYYWNESNTSIRKAIFELIEMN